MKAITRRKFLKRIAGSSIGLGILSQHSWWSAASRAFGQSQSGKVVFGAREDIDVLDPHITNRVSTRKILSNLYDPLVRHVPGSAEVFPGLAESWEISPDLKQYTFHLKQGVKFHDGTPFDAEAMMFSFDRIQQPEASGGVAKSLIGPSYQSAEVVDEFTIRVNFSQPFASFLDIAGLGAFTPVSPTAVAEFGEDFAFNPVGTGPFMLKEWVQGSRVNLVRNPDYDWASPIFDNQGPAFLDEVEWRIMPEAGTRTGALESGQIDIAEEPSFVDIERLSQSSSFQTVNAVPRGSSFNAYLDVNMPGTDSLIVRQAMQHAVNREDIVSLVMRGFSSPSYSPLQSTMPGFNPTLNELYPFNPERARQLLAADGWDPGSDGIRAKNGQRLELSWDIAAAGRFEEIGPLIQAQLRDVGIDLKMQTVSFSAYVDVLIGGGRNLVEIVWWFPSPSLMQTMFGSDSIFNASRAKNSALDELILNAEGLSNEAERVKAYQQAQKIVMNQALILPIAENPTIHVLNEKVRNYKTSFLIFPLFYDVFLS